MQPHACVLAAQPNACVLAAAIVQWRSGTNFTDISADHTCGGIVQNGVWDAPDCAGRVNPNADIGELAEGRGKLGEARATADSEVSKGCQAPDRGRQRCDGVAVDVQQLKGLAVAHCVGKVSELVSVQSQFNEAREIPRLIGQSGDLVVV